MGLPGGERLLFHSDSYGKDLAFFFLNDPGIISRAAIFPIIHLHLLSELIASTLRYRYPTFMSSVKPRDASGPGSPATKPNRDTDTAWLIHPEFCRWTFQVQVCIVTGMTDDIGRHECASLRP